MFRQVLTQTARRTVAPIQRTQKSFSTVGGQFAKDESALERDFIHKEERALLENLANLQKKKQNLDYSVQIKSLSETLVAHKVEPTPNLVQDLMKWRLTVQ